ncbi:hypothetical protein [Nocardia sp. NPDC005366]|uniref:hypothetical protein n=1 Tax=Nocardia sp. NPDC005366 TaxID=3156878 RepID=UPI0033B5B81F
MTGVLRGRLFQVIFLGVVLIFPCGCSNNAADLRSIAACGELKFPAGTELVEYDNLILFGDQVSVAIVDMPSGKIAEFKRESKLDRFEPGVPDDWKEYWRGSDNFDMIESGAGNEHLEEAHRLPSRWVVVHDLEGDSSRVFIRAAC